MKNLADQLTIVKDPLTDLDLILYLIHGLGPEYDSIVTSVTFRSYLISFDELQSLLMTNESHLECHMSVFDLSMKLQANLTFQPGSR